MRISCHLLVAAERRLADGDTIGFGAMTNQLYEIFVIFITIKNYPLFYASVGDAVVAGDFDVGFLGITSLCFYCVWMCSVCLPVLLVSLLI